MLTALLRTWAGPRTSDGGRQGPPRVVVVACMTPSWSSSSAASSFRALGRVSRNTCEDNRVDGVARGAALSMERVAFKNSVKTEAVCDCRMAREFAGPTMRGCLFSDAMLETSKYGKVGRRRNRGALWRACRAQTTASLVTVADDTAAGQKRRLHVLQELGAHALTSPLASSSSIHHFIGSQNTHPERTRPFFDREGKLERERKRESPKRHHTITKPWSRCGSTSRWWRTTRPRHRRQR